MLIIIPLDKNVIYSFLCSFEDIGLNDKLIYQRLVDMFLNRVVLFDDHCDIYFNTNDDKTKQLKLKEQPDLKSEILFESNKNTQLNLVFSWVQIGGAHSFRIRKQEKLYKNTDISSDYLSFALCYIFFYIFLFCHQIKRFIFSIIRIFQIYFNILVINKNFLH